MSAIFINFAATLSLLLSFPALAADKPWAFGVLSQRSPVLTAQYWNPILDHVERKTGIRLALKIARTDPESNQATERGEYDFVYSNTIFQPKMAAANYQVILRSRDEAITGGKKNLPKPASWADLTNPIYKDSIVMPNPASSGTGYQAVYAWIQLMGEKAAWEFMDKLHQNITVYTHSGSAPCVQAAKGERIIGLGFDMRGAREKTAGAPIDITFTAPVSSTQANRAWITVVEAGKPPSDFGTWQYVDDRATAATLKAPTKPGAYEVRLHTDYPAKSYNVRHVVTLTVTGGEPLETATHHGRRHQGRQRRGLRHRRGRRTWPGTGRHPRRAPDRDPALPDL